MKIDTWDIPCSIDKRFILNLMYNGGTKNMKFYSEELNKLYESQEECEKAESEALEAKKRAEEEQEKLVAERKARAAEVDDARKAMVEAQNKYEELLRDFIRDYKTYHYSTNNIDEIPRFFNDFFMW